MGSKRSVIVPPGKTKLFKINSKAAKAIGSHDRSDVMHPYRRAPQVEEQEKPERETPTISQFLTAVVVLTLAARFGWWLGDCLRLWGFFP